MVHLGQNIAMVRGMKRLTQKDVASRLKMTQPEYSRIEQKEEIDDDLLDRIAAVLEVTPETIKKFHETVSVFNINNHVENNTFSDSATAISQQFNAIEKIVEIYERLLKEKDRVIELSQQQKP